MMLWYIQVGNLIVMVVLLSYWCQFDFSIDSAQHSMHSFTSLLERKELNWSYCHCIKYIVVFGIFSIQTNTLHHSPMQEFEFIFANISWASKIEWLYWNTVLAWLEPALDYYPLLNRTLNKTQFLLSKNWAKNYVKIIVLAGSNHAGTV